MKVGDVANAMIGEHDSLKAYVLIPKSMQTSINRKTGVVTVKIDTKFKTDSGNLNADIRGSWYVVQVVDKK